jgi:hypothetical protein
MKKSFFIKRNKSKLFFAIVSLAFVLASCEKNLETLDSLEVFGTTDLIPNNYFDWETVSPMPQPPGYPIIYSPFIGSGTIDGYDDDIVDDHKKSDGWEMEYSTFSYNDYDRNPFFILYNRYRGLLRVYLYISDIGAVPSDYIQFGIQEKDSKNYKYLNLDNQEIIDPNSYVSRVDKMQTSTLRGNAWYMLQYEIGYDTRPTRSVYYPPTFWIYVNAVNVTDIKINGELSGTLKGTLGGSSTSSAADNIFKSLTTNGTDLGKKVFTGMGKGVLEKDSWNCYASWDKIKEGAWKAIQGNLPGAITSVLSAVVGGSSSTSGKPIMLNLEGALNMSGTLEDTYTLPGTPLRKYLPGTVAMLSSESGSYYSSTILDQVPLYNQRLGVFNLEGRPKVYESFLEPIEFQNDQGFTMYKCTSKYTINNSQVYSLLRFNPAVINSGSSGATIQNLTYEIVLKASEFQYNPTIYERKEYASIGAIFTSKYSVNAIVEAPRPKEFRQNYLNPMVRISFRVVPNNGAPATTIIKTFKADFIQ